MDRFDSFEERSLLTERVAEEGMILIKNVDGSLPFEDRKVAVFGRGQIDTVFTGTGSACVHVDYKTSIIDGMIGAGINIDENLLSVYRKWISENKLLDMGIWGGRKRRLHHDQRGLLPLPGRGEDPVKNQGIL